MFDWVKQGGYALGECYNKPSADCFHTFYVKLIENPDFKRMFINRSAVLFQNYVNGTNLSNIIESMTESIDEDQRSADQGVFKQSERGYTNSCG